MCMLYLQLRFAYVIAIILHDSNRKGYMPNQLQQLVPHDPVSCMGGHGTEPYEQ